MDADKNYLCDTCGGAVPCKHENTTTAYAWVDGSKTHRVTVTCECGDTQVTTEACVDENADNKCDYCQGNQIAIAQVGEQTYTSLQAAINNAGIGGYVKLVASWDQDVTVSNNLYLDLNGYSINATVTVAEGATLYGMDSTTDDYDCSNGYGKISSIIGSCAAHHKAEADSSVGKILRYLTVTEEDGISFHRFYLGIQSVTLKTSVTGFGYKAIFGGDEKVVAQLNESNAFGYNLWLDGNGITTSAYGNRENFVSGKQVSLRLKNFDIENYGSTEVYATVYLKFGDEVITSSSYACSMQTMLETVNENISQYTGEQIQAVQKMLENVVIPEGWKIDAILGFESDSGTDEPTEEETTETEGTES